MRLAGKYYIIVLRKKVKLSTTLHKMTKLKTL